jgi:hypothetical protein
MKSYVGNHLSQSITIKSIKWGKHWEERFPVEVLLGWNSKFDTPKIAIKQTVR